jgi:DNA replication and repair protein RecF
MRVLAVMARDFRGYREARATLGSGLTVIGGPNGAGKTNLLEALYFGCTGRSCRTSNERELIRFGAAAARVVIDAEGEDGAHELSVGLAPGQPKLMRLDGAPVQRLLELEHRPLVGVFLPDRLELIKGPPGLRRVHIDQFIAALWPSRIVTRRAYAQALAQRNALIGRIRSAQASSASLTSWDLQLARHGLALMEDRRRAIAALSARFGSLSAALGLDGDPSLGYRPRSRAAEAAELAAELAARTASDLQRGYTGHGPHRDEISILRQERELRTYGSGGQQRLALLALLLAERDAIAAIRASPPLMLLDDVMSELDEERRHALMELLSESGQSVITTTEFEHVPGAREPGVMCLEVCTGYVQQDTSGMSAESWTEASPA